MSNKRISILITISTIIVLSFIYISINRVLDEIERQQHEPIYQEVEVPVVVTEEKIVEVPVAPTEEDIYKDYLSKLTDENREDWYKGYKVMKSTWDEQPTTIYDAFDEESVLLLMYTVENETRGSSFNAKCNVASVIFNRLYAERFNNSLKGVITSPNQFCYSSTNISESTRLACEYAFEIEDTADGCLYFQSAGYSSTFSGGTFVFQDDAVHYFYR